MEEKSVISYTVERHEWEDEKKKKKSKTPIVVTFVVLTAIVLSFIFGYSIAKTPQVINGGNDKLDYIKHVMRRKWYFSKDIPNVQQVLDDNALKGVTSFEVDKHTEYLSRSQFQMMNAALQGTFYGIGISYSRIANMHVVNKVYPNSPAEKAGLMQNDIITKVNGEEIKSLDNETISKKVRGPKGTVVRIGFSRGGQERTVDITRDSISHTLESSVVDNVGIVHLNSFTENGAPEMKKTLQSFQNRNIKNIIIDLRDNGGGYLKTTMGIAGLLMPNGSTVLQQEDVNGKMIKNKTTDTSQFRFNKIVVLINENSASASEVLAAALRENLGIQIVGVRSFGKGTVQVTEAFRDGSAIKYTVAQWLTPNGKHINKVGVVPDVEVRMPAVLRYVDNGGHFSFQLDQVDEKISTTQRIMKLLGYTVRRLDGYFDHSLVNALKDFQSKNNMQVTGVLDRTLFDKIRIELQMAYNQTPTKFDTQLLKALEIVNGQ